MNALVSNIENNPNLLKNLSNIIPPLGNTTETTQPSPVEEQNSSPPPDNTKILKTIETIFHQSWFQDRILKIVENNLKTQYFEKLVEINTFNSMYKLLETLDKNNFIIVAISILKNNTDLFQTIIRYALYPSEASVKSGTLKKHGNTKDTAIILPDVVDRQPNTKYTTIFSSEIMENIKELLKPGVLDFESNNVDAQESLDYTYMQQRTSLDIQTKKNELDKEQAEFEEKMKADREIAYQTEIKENAKADTTPISDEDKETYLQFFNNLEKENERLISGEQYMQLVVNTVTTAVGDSLTKKTAQTAIFNVILNRLDKMLQDSLQIIKENGFVKTLFLNILNQYHVIYDTMIKGIEKELHNRLNLQLSETSVINARITIESLRIDNSFLISTVDSIVNELAGLLTEVIPAPQNPDIITGGKKEHNNKTKKKLMKYLKREIIRKRTYKLNHNGGGGWLW